MSLSIARSAGDRSMSSRGSTPRGADGSLRLGGRAATGAVTYTSERVAPSALGVSAPALLKQKSGMELPPPGEGLWGGGARDWSS